MGEECPFAATADIPTQRKRLTKMVGDAEDLAEEIADAQEPESKAFWYFHDIRVALTKTYEALTSGKPLKASVKVNAAKPPEIEKADELLVKALRVWFKQYKQHKMDVENGIGSVMIQAFGEQRFMKVYRALKQTLGKVV